MRIRRLLPVALPVVLALNSTLSAQFLDEVRYELLPGSYWDSCQCERPDAIQVEITGDFEFSQIPTLDPLPRRIFDIQDFSAWSDEIDLQLNGSGRYLRWDNHPFAEEAQLSLLRNGTLEQYATITPASRTVFPFLDLLVAREGNGDQAAVRVLARPAVQTVPWEIVAPSVMVSRCIECDGPDIVTPIRGTLEMGLYYTDGHEESFVVDDVDIRDDGGEVARGHGRYRALPWSGADYAQEMELRLDRIGGDVTLASGFPSLVGKPGETIVVNLEEVAPTGARALSLELHARRGASDAFRRGDVDANGEVDMADAIENLEWLFLGGPVPTCREAVDIDGNRQLNVSDPVWLLRWLYLGGPPPPFPGPHDCGEPDEVTFGCYDYSACER